MAPARLPVATTSTFGVVEPDGSSITIASGVISATSTPLPSGSANQVVATPAGSTGTASLRALVAADIPALNYDANGAAAAVQAIAANANNLTSGTVPAARLPIATTSALGAVKPDLASITVSAGVISAASVFPELTVYQLATPVTNTPTTATTGGSLAASTAFYYRVAATDGIGTTLASAEKTVTTGSGTPTNTVTVTWAAVTGATGYKIYGRSTGVEQLIGTLSSGTLSFTDTGSVTPAGALPTVNTTGNVTVTGLVGVSNAAVNAAQLTLTSATQTVALYAGNTTAAAPVVAGDSVLAFSGAGLVVEPAAAGGDLRMDSSGNVAITGALSATGIISSPNAVSAPNIEVLSITPQLSFANQIAIGAGSTNATAVSIQGGTSFSLGVTGNAAFAANLSLAGHLIASGLAVTVSTGSGAGTSPTGVSITGTDVAGVISVTTGSAPAATSLIAMVTFRTPYPTASPAPCVFVQAQSSLSTASQTTAALTGAQAVWVSLVQSGSNYVGFNLNSNTSPIAASTTYLWQYFVVVP